MVTIHAGHWCYCMPLAQRHGFIRAGSKLQLAVHTAMPECNYTSCTTTPGLPSALIHSSDCTTCRYTTLIPTLDHQTSLLTFSSQELQLLQHTELAAAAHQWQQTVTAAYKAAIMGHAAFSFARLPPPTPADYLWAVASAESRAFGIKVSQPAHACSMFCSAAT